MPVAKFAWFGFLYGAEPLKQAARIRTVAAVAACSLGLLGLAAPMAHAAGKAEFSARGGINHAYVLDAKRGQTLRLVNARGRTVGADAPTGWAARSSASSLPGRATGCSAGVAGGR